MAELAKTAKRISAAPIFSAGLTAPLGVAPVAMAPAFVN